ncbi:hypothetical protein A8C56_15425 [Niabella ginsenosidivorans]|uniref:Uncharacterized protein n=1 Tax=Niabella ginsenosidivorans TaxID=1176587 RepID=A0A1A9I3R1_9BACT|nr:DUF2911 domain-containing protein [Niabella ginsenosidivorans]ANH82173.1 hypothetical protein A8C56_15425 [Niabella ginsenosidivorans]
MKHILVTFFLAGAFLASRSQVKVPAASSAQTVRQDFGLGTLEWSYSRPGLKGRTLYTDVAPAGKLWRTGANSATTLTVSDTIIIGGKTIGAGKYGLLTIPGRNSWTVIITKQTNVTADPTIYKEAEDVVRVPVKPVTVNTSTETFTIQLAAITPASAELQLLWGNVMVPIPVKTDIDKRIMASINASMQSAKPAYFAAANYYYDNNKDLQQAIEWYRKAATAQPDAYWVHYYYARALAKAGRTKEARSTAEKSKQLAAENHNPDYVKLNEQLLATL